MVRTTFEQLHFHEESFIIQFLQLFYQQRTYIEHQNKTSVVELDNTV